MNKVIVSGATSGLGLAIALKFLDEGFGVFALGRTSSGLKAVLRRPNIAFVRHDLTDLSKVGSLIALVKREQIDCFISNAGVYSDLGVDLSDGASSEILATNLLAPVTILKNLYRHYKKQQSGTIVSINSIAGLDPNFNEAIYCASKHGMRGFVRSLQIDATKNNIRVLDYYPGAMRTRMTRGRKGYSALIDPSEIAARIVSDVTSGRSFLPVSQELRRAPSTGSV